MKNAFSFLFVLSISLISQAGSKNRPSVPTQPPPPLIGGKIAVNSITHQGQGCPQGSVSTAVTDDVSTFSILYSGLQTEMTANSGVMDVRKNCWTTISISLPPGTQLILEGADYSGFYSLSDDAIYARYNTKYFFDNGAAYAMNNFWRSWSFMGGFSKLEQGPKTENFFWHTDAAGIKQFTQCGGSTKLNIINTVSLSAARPSGGSAVFDTMDAQFVQRYNAKLVACAYKFIPFPDSPDRFVNPGSEQISGQQWRER